MQALFSTLELVAPMNSTVLIQGETGTGKELIARTIHHNSPRADQRFVAFNAAAIPEPLAEAELFGHVKGAFTGAVANRVGRFELAHRGTLFIDEVASMSLPLQAKLLRALQEREVERVGDAKPVKVDIRVIAATNTDLKAHGEAPGRSARTSSIVSTSSPCTLPALRNRREDIPLLAQHFLKKSCRENGLPSQDRRPGRDAAADDLRLARQRAPVRERDRVRGDDERRRQRDPARSAALGHPRGRPGRAGARRSPSRTRASTSRRSFRSSNAI